MSSATPMGEPRRRREATVTAIVSREPAVLRTFSPSKAFATSGGSQVSHAGIYVGEGRVVHAPATGGTVKLDSLNKPYWQKAYLNAKRVIQPSNLAQNAH